MRRTTAIKSKAENTALLVALFLFQYALLIPLMQWVNGDVLVAISGILLIVVSFLINHSFRFSSRLFFTYTALLLVLFLKCIFDGSSVDVVIFFLLIAVPAQLIFSNAFDRKAFLQYCYKFAILNFFVLFWIPFFGKYNYMRFGYGLLLTPIFLYIRIMDKEKDKTPAVRFMQNALFFVSTLELFLYGARGCIFALALFFLLYNFFVNKDRLLLNTLLIALFVILYLNLMPLLRFFLQITNQIGFRSHSLYQFINQVTNGFAAASSGRVQLYRLALEQIKQHPFFGSPIHLSETGGAYVHNLFLQVWLDLGIFALVLLVVFLIYAISLMIRKDVHREDKIVLAVLFSLAIGRLMFSSILWKRPEFWMLISFTFSPHRILRYLRLPKAQAAGKGGHRFHGSEEIL